MKKRILALFIMVCLILTNVGQDRIAVAKTESSLRAVVMPQEEQTTEPEVTTEPEQKTETPGEKEAETPSEDRGAKAADGTELQLSEQKITAECPQGTAYEGDTIVLSGMLPEGAVAEAIPTEVEVDGQQALVAYDISVYASEEQRAQDIKWQPEDSKIAVEISSPALEETSAEVEVWSKNGEDADPEKIAPAAPAGDSVVYETDTLAVNAVVETVLKKTITVSDGSTYDVQVTYKSNSGVPMNDTELVVTELLPGDAGYDDYVAQSATKLGVDAENIAYSRVFDIKIVDKNDNSRVYEPSGDVDVRITLAGSGLDDYAKVEVVHFVEDEETSKVSVYDMGATVDGETVAFTTDSFSVYTVIAHEDGEVVTPRVEFHFLAPTTDAPTTENGVSYYTTDSFWFENKAGKQQRSLIVRNGDTLEMIEAPHNLEDAFFYGWYTVDYDSTGNDGSIRYSWPDDTSRVELGDAVEISAEKDGDGKVTSVTWTFDGVSYTVSSDYIDKEGCAHVYLAPIYENYYFVNFHLGARGETTATNILARKLAVIGNSHQTSVRIGDIQAPSMDPVHLIFVGWEYNVNANNGGEEDWQLISTIDIDGEEIINPAGGDGTYMTVGQYDVDLYPKFVEARWIHFNLGASGNGALYVGSEFMYTSDINEYPQNTLPVAKRNGYIFDGWYLSEDDDHNGTGIMVAGADGKIVHGVNGAEYSEERQYTDINGNPQTGLAFKVTTDGNLYVYTPLDSLNLYAKWVEDVEDVTYKVVIWKQKVTDSPYIADSAKTYDYYTHFERKFVYAGNGDFTVGTTQADRNFAAANPNGDFTGFHLGRYDADVDVDTQGSTVLNVYYDRDVHRLMFEVGGGQNGDHYSVATDNNGRQWAFLNREFVELTYRNNGWYIPEYEEVMVQDSEGDYGLVNGNYVKLSKRYEYTSTLTAGKNYLIASSTNTGSIYVLGHDRNSVANDVVTVRSGNPNYINSEDVEETSVWSVANGYTFKNGDVYLNRNNNTLSFGANPTNWNWSGSYHRLSNGSGSNTRYIRYNSGFTLSSNNTAYSVYLYQEAVYYDNNGVLTEYTGNYYSKQVVQSGNYTEYNGTRYKRTNSTTHTVYIIEALYEQNISEHFPIVGTDGVTYDSGQRWEPQGDSVWTQVMVYVDTMPGRDVSFVLNTSNATTKTMTYYVEALDGDENTVTFDGMTFVHYGNPVRANYTFITEEDYVDLTGFDKYKANPGYMRTNSNGVTYYVTTANGNTYATAVDFYYTRSRHNLTFAANYPNTFASTEPEATVVEGVYYGAPLAEYGNTPAPVAPNSDYYFAGWYEDASCTVEFEFDIETMPAANKIVYAKWALVEYTVNIDPNGGVIDHINYGDETASGLGVTGLENAGTNAYDGSKATYFNNLATQTIVQYTNVTRPYVEISDAEAAQMQPDEVYRYVYMYYSGYEQGVLDGKLSSDARNAVYIIDTPASLEAYYNYYVAQIAKRNAERNDTLVALPQAQWESVYVSSAKYRKLRSGEKYVFLAWYEIDDEGNRAAMPFDFTQPADHDTTLRAYWRLDGGYSLQYTTEYYASNGDYVNGSLEAWFDPEDGSEAYTDGATTQAMQEPTPIRVNGVDSDEYQFRGWQIVKVETVAGRPRYTALEPGVYYTAGHALTVQAKYSDANMIIHMQAVYEKRDEAFRRPDVVSLTLDASEDASHSGQGYLTTSATAELPEWNYPNGHYIISELVKAVNGADQPYQILFGDTQSNAAVHLYKYATTLTESEITGEALSPAGSNFFAHTLGYKLIGFDVDSPDDNFVPDFAADDVVAVSPNTSHTLYAVWEPMVYLDLVNETEQTLTVKITSEDNSALYVVNRANGEFSREPVDPNNITLEPGTTRLVMPYGADKTFTLSGTNTLGTGWVMEVTSSYAGRNGEEDPEAVTRIKNNTAYSISDQFYEDAQGRAVTVTLSAQKSPRTLVLHDNDPVDSTWEESFDINQETYTLRETRSRVGREFKGWDENPDVTTATYPVASNGTMYQTLVLAEFFRDNNGDAVEEKHLYAIWGTSATANVVKVYKEVILPGDQSREFTFRVQIQGSYVRRYHSTENHVERSGLFTLSHGQYLVITMNHRVGSNAVLYVTVRKYNADGTAVTSNGTVIGWTNPNNYNCSSVTLTGVTVTETTDSFYETATEIVGVANSNYPINPAGITENNNVINWTAPEAGGTVVFTNSRKTADVTITKTLLPETLNAENFPFSVEFVNGTDSTHYEGFELEETSRIVVSGSEGWKIEGIPVGAKLRFTETVDETLYKATATAAKTDDGSSVTDENTTDDSIFEFVLEDDTEVSFVNTMKTQKVRLVVVDDEGTPLDSANFTFPGVFAGTKFSAAGTGLVFEDDEVFVGTYTLTETSIPDHAGVRYIKLQNPVSVTIGEDGLSVPAGTENVTLSATPDENGYYTITVINPRLARVTVKKTVVNDYNSNSFLFTVLLVDSEGNPISMSNVYGADGTDTNGKLEFTLVSNQTAVLYVPKSSTLTIEEMLDEWYDTEFRFGPDADNLGELQSGLSVQFTDLDDDRYAEFTNTRRMVEVTLTKTVVGKGGDFDFTATVMNGTNVLTAYEENDFTAGVMTFTITVADDGAASQILTIPCGAKLVIEEAVQDGYSVKTISEEYTDNDGDETNGAFEIETVLTDGTVTFTNTEDTCVAPTSYNASSTPYIWMFVLGGLMILIIAMGLRRKEEEEA